MEGSTMASQLSGIITALESGFGDMATAALSAIGSIVPDVLPILAAIIVIGIILRIVRSITG